MEKFFLSSEKLLLDSFKLARQIWDSGWKPDVMIALWRGGTPVGCVVHEYLQRRGIVCDHAAIKVASYTGIGARGEVIVENGETVRAQLKPGSRILVVDDVFDTGSTAHALHRLLEPLAGDIRFAMPYFKSRSNVLPYTPDYYVHRMDSWLVFPHELHGLTSEEIQTKDPFVAELLEL